MTKKFLFFIMLVLSIGWICCGCKVKSGKSINVEMTCKEKKELSDGFDYWKLRDIRSYKQINKIVVKVNESIDTSWIRIPDVYINDEDKIKYFYEKICEMKVEKNKMDDIDLDVCEKVKERDIYVYDEKDNYSVIHYNPFLKTMMAFVNNINEDENYVCLKSIYDEFDNWLIENMQIDINKDYSKYYDRGMNINSSITLIQKFEDDNWYGGYKQDIINDKLYLVIYLKDEKEKYKKTIEKIIDKNLIAYRKCKYSCKELEKISEEIYDIIDKYEYVNNIYVEGDKVIVGVDDVIGSRKEKELKDALKKYTDVVEIKNVEKNILE